MPNKEEKPLKELVDKMLRAYGLSHKLDEMDLIKNWEKLVGKMIARHTTNIYLKDRVLCISLDSAPLRQELSYAKSSLIQRLNEASTKNLIDDIKIS
ncbi:MAG: RNA-binding protein [Verrucomicrobia bacterium]|nr:RNA-binding protein [Verrucomicrobiota bacterium]